MVWWKFWDRQNTVDFYGDFIDPFCYIGFSNLLNAIENRPIKVRWRGFELDPDLPPEGAALHLVGNSDLRAGMWPSVVDLAKKSGIDITPPAFAPNTQKAHLLVLNWPGKEVVKNPLIARIFRAYLSEQKDIGNSSILIELAGRFGVSQSRCEEVLRNHKNVRRLERHRKDARRLEFPGLPGIRYRGQTRFGALPLDEWRRLFG
jgi:predicted DsbA family dithiol-disulfide isomerase